MPICWISIPVCSIASCMIGWPCPALQRSRVLLLRTIKILIELRVCVQSCDNRGCDELASRDVARIMDRADDPALSIFAATGEQCLTLLRRDFRQNQCRRPTE